MTEKVILHNYGGLRMCIYTKIQNILLLFIKNWYNIYTYRFAVL